MKRSFPGPFGRAAALAWLGMLFVAPPASAGPIVTVSAGCPGPSAEVEQAADRALGYVYEMWMGCGSGQIGFARSTDGGRSFAAPSELPGSMNSAWDPAIAVAPDSTVYAVFMRAKADKTYPVLDASYDHGQTFSQVSSLIPSKPHSWGDRPFVALAPDGTVYITWQLAPRRSTVTLRSAIPGGSGWYSSGDLNVVIQKSTDHGRTWSRMAPIGPGFPASGGQSAPLVVEPSGRIDLLYFRYTVANRRTYALGPAYNYFTFSSDGGSSWSVPVRLGGAVGTMSVRDWWIDGAIAIDAGGNLYATWDTQGKNRTGGINDVGWLSFSTDHGRSWSHPVQVPAGRRPVPHIVEVAGGAPGTAYVGWLSDGDPRGFALYLRVFAIGRGWLTSPIRVSRRFGRATVWPGDTFGISLLPPSTIVLSWGSAPGKSGRSDIYSTRIVPTG